MSKFFIFIFNLLPNFLILRHIKEILLKMGGVSVKMRSCYILKPFYIDNAKKLSISKGVFINKCSIFEGNGNIYLGDNCQIGPNVIIATTNHDVRNQMECITKDVIIKENVWIGAGTIINPGITLGPNVTIASGSVVTKNFRNCTIAGIPAKMVENK